jgi:peptidyl-tRNA hydrolase
VRSILAEWGSADFHRVRMGIGRPVAGRDAAGHVLGGFSAAERAELPEFFARAADAGRVHRHRRHRGGDESIQRQGGFRAKARVESPPRETTPE